MNVDIVVSVTEAALFFRVPERTVRTWIRRYSITPGSSPGRLKYRLKALIEAEFRARTSAGGRPRKAA